MKKEENAISISSRQTVRTHQVIKLKKVESEYRKGTDLFLSCGRRVVTAK